MNKGLGLLSRLKNERGATAIIVALLMFAFIGFTALAVDVGHLFVVDNELQNAADAGALAGARFLYNEDGTINGGDTATNDGGANAIANDAAEANKSEGVDVESDGEQAGDSQRGHWSFATRTFTPKSSLKPFKLFNVSTEELDSNTLFINAVMQTVKRKTIPANSFFAKIFGYDNFVRDAVAVAYIGFAGSLDEGEADQPIVICEGSILNDYGEYDCSIGRMINSGQSVETSESGGWTSFNQEDNACSGTSANEVKALVCSGGNEEPLTYGDPMATNGGEIQSAFTKLRTCWVNAAMVGSEPDVSTLWQLMLPVVTCPGNNVGTCEELVGAVTVNIVWITGSGEDPDYSEVPTSHAGWESLPDDAANGQARWNDFVQYWNLKNVDGTNAPYQKKAIYFLPDCAPHIPTGGTGGTNFGVLAKVPVLVN